MVHLLLFALWGALLLFSGMLYHKVKDILRILTQIASHLY